MSTIMINALMAPYLVADAGRLASMHERATMALLYWNRPDLGGLLVAQLLALSRTTTIAPHTFVHDVLQRLQDIEADVPMAIEGGSLEALLRKRHIL